MQTAMENLEAEREGMMDEIRNVLSGAGEDLAFLSRFSIMDEANSRSSSPAGSAMTHGSNLTPSQSADFIAKSRALAEQRLSMHGNKAASGRSSGHGHTSASGHSMRRTQSSDNLSKEGKDETRSTSGNHFPDDQMNFEIQQRTSVVTSQISKIQQQLESTLSNLEGRRSNMHDRGTRRRGSVSSVHSRYEYGPPSSLGHGARDGASSVMSHSGDREGRSYEAVENLHPDNKPVNGGAAKIRRTPSTSGVDGARSPGIPPIKSPARQKEPENAWKSLGSSSNKAPSTVSESPATAKRILSGEQNPISKDEKTASQGSHETDGGGPKSASPTQAPLSDNEGSIVERS